MESSKTALVALLLMSVLVGGRAICTVQNESNIDLTIDVGASVVISLAAGTSVDLLPSQQSCKFKNAKSGHECGPVQLQDDALYVAVGGAIAAVVDIYRAILHGTVSLTVPETVELICSV